MKKSLLFFAACALFFVSCEKEEVDKAPIDASKQKMLMDGYWELSGYVMKANIEDSMSAYEDMYTPIPGCQKDDLYAFVTTSTFTRYEGETKCTLAAPDSTEYSYELLEDEKRLVVWSDPDNKENSILYNAEITYHSTREFVLRFTTYNDGANVTSEHVQTYRKLD